MKRKKYYWEDFPIGSVTEYGGVTLSKEDIVRFAKEFDPQPFHIDEEAAKHSQFGGLIASGWHTCSLMMQRYAVDYLSPASSLASPGMDELRWLQPVRPGDALAVRVTIESARASDSKPDRGVVRSLIEVLNQRGEPVMTMRAVNMIARRPRGT